MGRGTNRVCENQTPEADGVSERDLTTEASEEGHAEQSTQRTRTDIKHTRTQSFLADLLVHSLDPRSAMTLPQPH